MSRELLVTGGAGFIGLNFIRFLLKESDYKVTVIDSLTYASNIVEIYRLAKNERVRLLPYDLTDFEQLSLAMDREYEAIVHFAAETHVDNSIMNADPFIQSNIIGTYHLLKFLQKGCAKRMIHISTDEVYGSLKLTDPSFTEKSPIAPQNPYSATKASSDLLVLSYFNTHKVPVIVTRCSNNYGPFQHHEKFIPKIIKHALEEKPIPLYGDGLQIRDWLFVEDHCRAIHAVLEKGKEGEIYNIGGGNEKTNKEVVSTILQLLSKDDHLIAFIEDRKGHDRRYSINSEKLQKELGWSQVSTFEEGLKATIDWYVKKYGSEKR